VIDDNPAIHEDFRKVLCHSRQTTDTAFNDVEMALFGETSVFSKEPGFEIDSAYQGQEGLALVEEVGHQSLGLLLDTFHMNIEETQYDAAIRSLARADRLFHVHLGDSNRLAPGQGHIDFPTIVTSLCAVGYRGYLSAELLARPDGDAAAANTAQYMRSLLHREAPGCDEPPRRSIRSVTARLRSATFFPVFGG